MSKLEGTRGEEDRSSPSERARHAEVASPTVCQFVRGPLDSTSSVVMPHAERAVAARTVFGPFYTHEPTLQAAINHAERAHRVVELLIKEQDEARRAHNAPELSHSEQWLSGRDSELLVWVGEHVNDWRSGAVTTLEAARGIEAYVQERIHDGLRAEFNREPPCCLDVALAPTSKLLVDASAAPAPWAVVRNVSPAAESTPSADESAPASVPPPSSTPVSPAF